MSTTFMKKLYPPPSIKHFAILSTFFNIILYRFPLMSKFLANIASTNIQNYNCDNVAESIDIVARKG